MLARRFTIVCLLTALFGIFFATLVVQKDQHPRTWVRVSSSAAM